ncbi:hypothetical protein A7982_13291 [Minicystis rosea]|nr:hypothetical protein A7982_13291 [Minicystis rosea]
MLYELGNVLVDLERRSRRGALFWTTVRTTETRPGTVVVEIITEPKA